jgi:PleD family two-component response regulator
MQNRGSMAKVLVIDEDRSTLARLELLLTKDGYETVTASTGTDGLNRYVERYPDLVILDVFLSDVGGFNGS